MKLKSVEARLVVALVVVSGCSPSSDDASHDAGLTDVAQTQNPASDASLDAGVEAGLDRQDAESGAACHPGSILGFQPPATVPVGVRSQACNGFGGEGGIVPAFRDDCLDTPGAYPPCTLFDAGDQPGASACLSCLVSSPTPDGTYSGAIAYLGSFAEVNFPVCIEVVDPTEAGAACALAVQSTGACVLYACQGACPVADPSSAVAIRNCLTEAAVGPCLGYTLRSNACIAAEEGDGGSPVARICFPPSDPTDKYNTFVQYLCGAN